MKYLASVQQLPAALDVVNWRNSVKQLIAEVSVNAIHLSMEERSSKRKMGSQRLAYAIAANRLGLQHIKHLPRDFEPDDFDKLLAARADLVALDSYLKQLEEILSDYIMALGIDAMTNTKTVHDALRSANSTIPELDTALKELDEFNKRSAAEDAEEVTANTIPDASTTDTAA